MPAGTGERRWWALAAVNLCVLAGTVDGTVLSVAQSTLARTLHATESDLEWFTSGYLLLLAAAALPAGLIGDRFGRKKLLVACLAAFGAGSVLCAESPSPGIFLIARLLMGLAASGITVMAMSALSVLFGQEERAKAVGIYEAANFLGLPAGTLLGGWMLSRLWWGWVFLVNVPVVALGLVAAIALIPESRAAERPGLDLPGIAASTAGLVALTYGLIQAGQDGWGAPASLALMAAGLAALAGFAAWERRAGERNGSPLVDPGLFRSASFRWGAVLGGVAGLAMIGVLFIMPQYFQAIQGATALGSGLRLLPLIGGLVAGALPASALARAAGAKLTVTLGFAPARRRRRGRRDDAASPRAAFIAIWMAVLGAGTGLTLDRGDRRGAVPAVGRAQRDRLGGGPGVPAHRRPARHRHPRAASWPLATRPASTCAEFLPLPPARPGRAFTAAWPPPAGSDRLPSPALPAAPSPQAWTPRSWLPPGSPPPAPSCPSHSCPGGPQ